LKESLTEINESNCIVRRGHREVKYVAEKAGIKGYLNSLSFLSTLYFDGVSRLLGIQSDWNQSTQNSFGLVRVQCEGKQISHIFLGVCLEADRYRLLGAMDIGRKISKLPSLIKLRFSVARRAQCLGDAFFTASGGITPILESREVNISCSHSC
jgi:hypothetical protein